MKQKKVLAAMVAVLLLATALRFYRLDAQSFWNDEGNSARLSERSITLIIEGTASDIHPPLYYLLLRGWREFVGESEFALRAMSAYFGIGLVAVTFALGKRLLRPDGGTPAVLAALLVALSPALIYYSQEARMYELMAFLAILSTFLLLHLLQTPTRRTGIAIAYVISVAAGLYTHYFFPIVLFTQAIIILFWLLLKRFGPEATRSGTRAPPLRLWLIMMVAIILLYLPWLPIFLRQAGGRSGIRAPLLEHFIDSGRWLLMGETIAPPEARLTMVAAGLLFALALFIVVKRLSRNEPGGRILLYAVTFSLLVIPVIFMWVIGTTKPEFYKFILLAVPSLSLILGFGWWRAWSYSGRRLFKAPWRVLLVLAAVLILWGSGRALRNMYFDPEYARDDYRAIASQIAAEAHPNAAVILNAANQWEVFTYYHRDGAPVFPLPKSRPDRESIAAELAEITASSERIYGLFWGEIERDPQRLVQRWLDSHAHKAEERWVGDVKFVTYAVAADPVEETTAQVGLRFGDQIILQGYSLPQESLPPGDILPLTLYWQAVDVPNQRYKVFLHLIDETGQIITQRDSEPGGGLALTTTWSAGEAIVDNYGLAIPDGTPGGLYTLLLGMYAIDDPAGRLPINAPGGVLDAYPLAIISVEDN